MVGARAAVPPAAASPLLGLVVAGFEPELARRRRRERDHLVGEVHALARRLAVAERLEPGDDDLLEIALARVDHVDDAAGAAEGRRAHFGGGDACAGRAVSHTLSSSHQRYSKSRPSSPNFQSWYAMSLPT